MRIKLKLTRSQYKGVATIVQNCCNALAGTTLEEVQYRDALMSLMLKMAARVPTLREKGNSLTLDEVGSLALWRTVNDLVQRFQPFEMSVGYWLLGEIDRQRMAYVSLMRANCVPAEGVMVQQNY